MAVCMFYTVAAVFNVESDIDVVLSYKKKRNVNKDYATEDS